MLDCQGSCLIFTGKKPDIEIFRHGLRSWLDLNERVEADGGYIGEARLKVKCPASVPSPFEARKIQAYVRNCQETVNTRFKQWNVLADVWRHVLYAHSTIFCAITVLTQLAILDGEPLFEVDYKDPA